MVADAGRRAVWQSRRMRPPRRLLLPSPALRPLVQVYMVVDENLVSEERHVSLPEHTAHLTFHAGRNWEVGAGGLLTPMPQAQLSGLSLTPTQIVSSGPVRAMRVELYPWAARQLFGWSFPDAPLDLSAGAAGPQAAAMARAIGRALSADDPETALGLVDEWLLRLAADQTEMAGPGVQAALQLYDSWGQLRVADLAQTQDVSPRTLERQFQQEVGVGPKTLSRLIRFEMSSIVLNRDPAMSLATLAHDMGFSDQAHLTREFRSLGGLTPGAYARMSELRGQKEAPVRDFELLMLTRPGREFDPLQLLPQSLGGRMVPPPGSPLSDFYNRRIGVTP